MTETAAGASDPVTVVVATRNRPDSLDRTLAAVAVAIRAGDRVIVADSASDGPGTRHVAEANGVGYLRVERPGAARARNAGARAATTDVVVFTDDDCLPCPGWAAAFAAAFAPAGVGFATGPVVPAEEAAVNAAAQAGDEALQWRWPDDPVDMGAGASMAFRTDALLGIGGFAEDLGPGAGPVVEDHDAFFRALRDGWEGRFVPGARVQHDDRRDLRATLRRLHDYGVGSGTLCARAAAVDPDVGRRMLRLRLWDRGVVGVAGDLRKGWERPALGRAVMAAGVLQGNVAERLRRRRPG